MRSPRSLLFPRLNSPDSLTLLGASPVPPSPLESAVSRNRRPCPLPCPELSALQRWWTWHPRAPGARRAEGSPCAETSLQAHCVSWSGAVLVSPGAGSCPQLPSVPRKAGERRPACAAAPSRGADILLPPLFISTQQSPQSCFLRAAGDAAEKGPSFTQLRMETACRCSRCRGGACCCWG